MVSADAPAAFKLSMCSVLMGMGLPGIVAVGMLGKDLLGKHADPKFADMPDSKLRIILMINPTILLIVAVLAGVHLAPRVGLKAPVIEAVLLWRPVGAVLTPQIRPAVYTGLGMAVLLTLCGWYQSVTIPELADHMPTLPMSARVLYGGIVEEILLRWGMMTVFVWLVWRLLQQGNGVPTNGVVWAANIAAALLFGAGHLPLAFSYGLSTPFWILLIVSGNTVGGVAFGWLYWKRGLEASMIGHALSHVFGVMLSSIILTSKAEL